MRPGPLHEPGGHRPRPVELRHHAPAVVDPRPLDDHAGGDHEVARSDARRSGRDARRFGERRGEEAQ